MCRIWIKLFNNCRRLALNTLLIDVEEQRSSPYQCCDAISTLGVSLCDSALFGEQMGGVGEGGASLNIVGDAAYFSYASKCNSQLCHDNYTYLIDCCVVDYCSIESYLKRYINFLFFLFKKFTVHLIMFVYFYFVSTDQKTFTTRVTLWADSLSPKTSRETSRMCSAAWTIY